MAKKLSVKGIIKRAKDFFAGNNAADDTALYPIERAELQDQDLLNHLERSYKEATDNIEPLYASWKDNRDAFMCLAEDQFGGNASRISINGIPLIFNCAITHQSTQDIVSIINSGNTKISPLPVVRQALNDEAYVRVNFPEILQNKRPEETPVDYVRRIVGYCYKDISERRNMHEKDAEIIRDVCLCGIGYSNIFTDFDYDTLQEDIFIKIEQPENVKLNPSATGVNETCRLMHVDNFIPPFEASQLYPEFQDDIYAEIDAIARKSSTSNENADRMKGLVKIIRSYIKDDTIAHVPVLTLDPETNESIQEADKEKGEPLFEVSRRYPNGRVITWLPTRKIILEDSEGERGVFPISALTDRKPSWSAIGAPIATPLRAAESAQNTIHQQMIANMKKAGNVIVEYVDGVDIAQITDEVGALIRVPDINRGIAVHGAQNIVGNAVEAAQMIRVAADQMCGLMAASVGRVPTGVVSGVAIAQLQEPTNRVMAEFERNFRSFKRDQGIKIGYLMMDMYKKGRVLHTSDEEGNPVVLCFDIGDVVLDIVCKNELDTYMPKDPKSIAEFAMQAAQTMMADGQPLMDRQGVVTALGYDFLKQAAIRADQRAQEAKMMKMKLQAQAQTGAQNPSISGPPNGAPPVSGIPAELVRGA